jgi:threonine synthase
MINLYESTRNADIIVKPSEAIVMGLSEDGGLFVPKNIDELKINLEELTALDFNGTAKVILNLFFNDFSFNQIESCVKSAYDDKFDTKEIVPLVKVGNEYIMELFHGKTIAFKDIALSILPYLMKNAEVNCDSKEDIVILTATSGDTGKAALEGFRDVDGIKIIVFYPKDGVSSVQKLQMTTQEGSNTYVVSVEGNFDDAQSAVKEIFNNAQLKKKLEVNGLKFSSANSINIGRLVPQITYYFTSYVKLLNNGEINNGDKVNFVVPTGNFGNILAGYLAKRLGLPINKLICAANENNVLHDFISTGKYDINREFIKTISPSMDILISSNLERLLYFMCGQNNNYIKELMDSLKNNKQYEVSEEIKAKLRNEFWSGYCTEEDTLKTIKNVYDNQGYVMDTHTAVAYKVYKDYEKESGDDSKSIILSTASPFKFAKSVYTAIYGVSSDEETILIDKLASKTGINIPEAIKGLTEKEILHFRNCSPSLMEVEILDIISEGKNA